MRDKACLLTIAGHDPSSGAGISADMAAAWALGVPALSVITALTTQTSQGVKAVYPQRPDIVQAQMEALLADMPIAAIKLGMLGSKEMVLRVAAFLDKVKVPIVLDTVFKASIGEPLLEREARQLFIDHLLPKADLITPNIPEVEQLTGLRIRTRADQLQAARALLSMGVKAVLVKGGHFDDALAADLLLLGNGSALWLVAPHINTTHSHGSGCVLAATIATGLVQGLSLVSAVVQAKARVHAGIAHAMRLGKGVGAVATLGWQPSSAHFPWLMIGSEPLALPTAFPPLLCPSIGIYPIVSSAQALLPLLAAGCRTLQLRIKSDDMAYVQAQIEQAVQLCRPYADCQLFINDHWQLAVAAGAYGVHLGQEDWQALSETDKASLRHSGIRLGLSTHNLAEMALAHAVRPSYIAIGPLFATKSKAIDHPALGVHQLADWVRWLKPKYPLVAIGGIELEHLASIGACGVDGVALIGALAGDAQTALHKARTLLQTWQSLRG